jgi:transglutaminase-like putative cysteine protease
MRRLNTRLAKLLGVALAACACLHVSSASAANAPEWMRAQLNAPLPAHDEETDAVALYSETELTVEAPGKMKRLVRRVYKILRSDGEAYGAVHWEFSPQSRVTSMRGWSIPAQGKDFEVKDRDVIETAITDVDGGELISDVRRKFMRIPASVPGSIIGFEIEQEMQPYAMTDEWGIQDTVPVREARYTVRLPSGWSHKVFWLNHSESAPIEVAPGQWRWVAQDLKPVKLERRMPPWRGIAARMVLSLQPPGGKGGGFQSWQEVGTWYLGLTNGRRVASPELRQKVQQLTASTTDLLSKMRALAAFAQTNIRYVAIELGIGGVQPHPASEVLAHGYGDCKDKVTLLSSMLKEIGVESHYVLINTERGSVAAGTPPNMGFNHVVLAIQLPAGVDTAQLPAVIAHKALGPVLFFDPTHPHISLGQLPGGLQANYGLLVAPTGGELLALPQSASALNGVERMAKFTLDDSGTLSGDVRETWVGDGAAGQRYTLRAAQQDVDQIKPVESMLTESLATFQILNAAVANLRVVEKPLIWKYTVEIPRYPRTAGDLLIIRPRVLGSMSSGLLETKKPRQNPIEFEAPVRNTDVFEITVPAGYVLDSQPPAVNEDLGSIAYRSSTSFAGNVLRYTRTLEVKELSVPLAKAQALKAFYRVIWNDERGSVVLKKLP